MRPILWGTIWFVIGLIGWLAFSVIIGIGEGLGGEEAPPILNFFLNFFAFLFYLSLPVSIIAEIIRWIKRRKKKNL